MRRPESIFLFEELLATWRVLSALLANYEPDGQGWETIVECRRIIEVEMSAQGYERQRLQVIGVRYHGQQKDAVDIGPESAV